MRSVTMGSKVKPKNYQVRYIDKDFNLQDMHVEIRNPQYTICWRGFHGTVKDQEGDQLKHTRIQCFETQV